MSEDLLTQDEHVAVRLAGELYTHIITNVIVEGDNQEGDTSELLALIHGIQRMVMGQAAARAFPKKYRLLGSQLELPKPIK